MNEKGYREKEIESGFTFICVLVFSVGMFAGIVITSIVFWIFE